MPRPKVCILRAAGTNCDQETTFAFKYLGAIAEAVHVNRLIAKEKNLDDYQILALPGGFTYGDDVAAGKILANELKFKLSDEIRRFLDDGKLIIGICNGFQILLKAGILPGRCEFKQTATLSINDSGKFEDRWVYLKAQSAKAGKPQNCIWTKGLPEIIYLPVAHGEGKFIAQDKKVLGELEENNQIVLRYCDGKGSLKGYPYNPNGSEEHIAGISDLSGSILGLMPHPERHIFKTQHPGYRRLKDKIKEGDGLAVFRNGIEYAKKNL